MRLAEYTTPVDRELVSADATLCAERVAGLADPTRVRILNLLANGELCVCDLVGVLDLPQPLVSRHLAYLRRSGWVEATRGPRLAHYRLLPASDESHAALLTWIRDALPTLAGLKIEREAGAVACETRRTSPC
jgi:ArsR family transcriptional regulator